MANSNLRHFKDLDDLFDNVENDLLLTWVNELHKKKVAQGQMGKRYRLKQQMLAKLAQEHLDKDEVERVKGMAAELAEEGR